MKNKFVFYLLLGGLLGMGLILLAGCDRTTELDDGESTIPHELGLVSGFTNCLACHAGVLQTGELEELPDDHSEYPAELCSSLACHPQSGEVPQPEWEPPVIATHEIVGAYDDCMVCHDVYKRYEPPVSDDHVIYTNKICRICHEVPEG